MFVIKHLDNLKRWTVSYDSVSGNVHVNITCNSISKFVCSWGGYGRDFICPTGTYITQCQLRVESRQGSGDDTAANNLNCKCSNNDFMNGDGTEWGGWMAFSQHCSKGICGLQTRVERSQGSGDDTALNDAKFVCC